MSASTGQNLLNDCGCCEGQTVSTPQGIFNLSGLPTIAYRIGDYHRFKDSMLTRLSSAELAPLQGLTTRDDNDFSIALIDAWASVAEVLCFYQEYFANEGLLRTAKERLSILEHARLIGELLPALMLHLPWMMLRQGLIIQCWKRRLGWALKFKARLALMKAHSYMKLSMR